MRTSTLASLLISIVVGSSTVCVAQEKRPQDTLPTAVKWTVSAANPIERTVIKSVFLLYCPKSGMKGTGFLLSNGLIITNNHVVQGCSAQEMMADPFEGREFGFTKMAWDAGVDLAVLRPAKQMSGGLELESDTDPELGTQVNIWGFPLTYNGPAPLLSIGYVAGYVKDGSDGKEVKHVVVNGAFNPGNSGGPLLRWKDNRVIGVVVAKFHLYPPVVEQAIQALAHNPGGFMYSGTDEQGKPTTMSEAQVVGIVLEQFYKTSQVMIGEAISVSELRSFLKKKQAEVQ